MESRKITVVSTRESSVTYHESSAETFGQLSQELSLGGMSVVVKETRNTLSLPDAVLPESAFTIFVSPTKVKSGANFTRFSDVQLQDMVLELEAEDTIDIDLQENLIDVISDCMINNPLSRANTELSEEDIETIERVINNGASGHFRREDREALAAIVARTYQEGFTDNQALSTPGLSQEELEKRALLAEARNLNL